MAILVLQTTSWPRLQKVLPRIVDAVAAATKGSYAEVATE